MLADNLQFTCTEHGLILNPSFVTCLDGNETYTFLNPCCWTLPKIILTQVSAVVCVLQKDGYV